VNLFLQAFFMLVVYDIVAATRPFHTVCSIVAGWHVSTKTTEPDIIDRACMAVNYACVCYPKPALCLQRSFVLTYLLNKHGIRAQMVLGAQKLPFKAHAWVEIDGTAVNERCDVKATYGVWHRC
jgi:hypothetical protein